MASATPSGLGIKAWRKPYALVDGYSVVIGGQAWAANVLVIQSYHSGYAWDAAYTKGLKEGLTPNINYTF